MNNMELVSKMRANKTDICFIVSHKVRQTAENDSTLNSMNIEVPGTMQQPVTGQYNNQSNSDFI
jgi:hypothetical protein